MKRILFYILVPFLGFCQTSKAQQLHNLKLYELIERQWIDNEHAKKFATIQVQDFQGRIKPIHTLSLELLRKIYGKSSFTYTSDNNQQKTISPTQVFLGMQFKPDSWQLIECIKISSKIVPLLQKHININNKGYSSASQFFDFSGAYKIKSLVDNAYAKAPGKRTTFDKEIIKVDERVNILLGIFNGQFLKIFPKKNDPNQKWYAPSNNENKFSANDSIVFSTFSRIYFSQLQQGLNKKNWAHANETIELIKGFQSQNGENNLIKATKIKWEIWYNNRSIFLFCLIAYCCLSVLLLTIAFVSTFSERSSTLINLIAKVLLFLFLILFLYHGFGLALRTYISGHAPWSNGYEATLFIAWVTVLAGLVFSKTNLFSISAASMLATCLLGIAHGSLMNPEITNLVPVLKSYWLLIHVAVITGSYGFLALGSILALICLILLTTNHYRYKEKTLLSIHHLTYINQLTTTIGLFLLTAGTFLGGIWANESWGRYWGWDPKETWALISIMTYSFVLHLRLMLSKNFIYLYNVCSLFAIASIIMTFFGVNFYLSGLHSYAKGDSFPIPDWIYIAVILLISISISPLIFQKYFAKKTGYNKIVTGNTRNT
ncbi:cytochrome c biogenesis protein CcsA [Aquimarina sp. D1M17]|uniref:cytochrome c biogenesis protein n=1 Tax=Aquimarina acroporae TaxID=2937283 RepID=UPI0020C12E05|nr:cytochrome c biogenesis protein CcsA [Aquimarina acroporae]MCK8523358.1 cytochrome c biogenesis protein CcsA [Aquimarina acroporae]